MTLLAVLSTQNNLYKPLHDTLEATCYSIVHPEVEVVYFYGHPLKENDGRNYYFDIPEGWHAITAKTLKAFEFFLTKDFDYFFRANESCYNVQDRLAEWLKDKPKTNFYAGFEGSYGIPFMLGSGYVLSRDVVEYVVQNKDKWDFSIPDDVALGKLLHNFPFYNKFGYCLFGVVGDTYDIWKYVDGVKTEYHNVKHVTKQHFDGCFHIRCKDPNDRTIDVKLMNIVHSLLFS